MNEKEAIKMEYIIDDYYMQYAQSRSSEEPVEIEDYLTYIQGW